MSQGRKQYRRRLQFSLGTLLIVVTIAAAGISFLIWAERWAAEREAFIAQMVPPGSLRHELGPQGSPFVAPWPLRMVAILDNLRGGPGDWRREGATHGYRMLGFNDASTEEEMQRGGELFPEANVIRLKSKVTAVDTKATVEGRSK